MIGEMEVVPEVGIYIHDGIYFYVDINTSITVCITISPDICEVDGVALDKNREELINIFGIPKSEWYDEEGGPYFYNLILDFEIQSRFVRFGLQTSDEKANFMEFFYSSPPQHYWSGRSD